MKCRWFLNSCDNHPHYNADCINSCNLTADEILNSPITYEETRGTISTLKKGKASSDDMIANELLKSLKGGGVHPDYFVKLDFEIAVDQQTRARDRTFEGVPDSG